MRSALIVITTAIVVVSILACKKSKSLPQPAGTITADSIELHRVGGFAGFQDHYLITSTRAKQDKDGQQNTGEPYIFNVALPQTKYTQVADVRTTVPQSLLTAPNPPSNDTFVADRMDSWIVIHYKGITKELSIENIPASETAYSNKLAHVLDVLR
jgi:hypothetical protein